MRGRAVQLEHAALDQHQSQRREDALPYRIDVDQGVLLPGCATGSVAVTTPDVHHRPTVHDDVHRRTQLFEVTEILDEGLPHRSEASVAAAVRRSVFQIFPLH